MYAYATNVRTPAKPSLVSADPANSAPHSLAHLGSPHSCGRRRDGHTARAVPWFIDYLSRLQPFFALSAFTHNDESGMPSFESAWCWPGTGETLPPCNVSESMLLSQAHTGVCARLESAWLPAGVADLRPSASYSHGAPQAERSILSPVAVKRVRASLFRLPFPGLQRDPPREWAFLIARKAAGYRSLLRPLR